MYKVFIYKANEYSHAYQSQTACADNAKVISAIHQCHTAVVDMNTGEVVQMFYCGLAVE